MIKRTRRLIACPLSCAVIVSLSACDLDTAQLMPENSVLNLARQSRVEPGPKIWSLNYGYSDIELDRPPTRPTPQAPCQLYPFIMGECPRSESIVEQWADLYEYGEKF